MKLLEVVRGKATSDQVILTAMTVGKRLGKVAVLAGNCFGFIGNRMVDKYLREAYFLVEEGASVEQVNQALYDFGMAMGPLAMDDLAGLDVAYLIRQEAAHLRRPEERQPLVADLLYKMGRYGQKTGCGWSRYDAQRKPSPDPEVAALIEKTAQQHGIQRRAVSNEEIVERCIGALINEGKLILREGIALRPVDIDIIYIYGYGFPAWRGGPMFYAENFYADTKMPATEALNPGSKGDASTSAA
jgi:3-hydroxyacyl-CoA dehydrogenase